MNSLPTFLLRGINHKAVLEAYNKGEYNEQTLIYSSNIPAPKDLEKYIKKSKQTTMTGTDSNEAVFIRKNNTYVYEVYTTNYDEYITALTPTENAKLPNKNYKKNTPCMWCRQSLSNKNIVPVPIPIKLTVKDGVSYFHNIGKLYCSTRCADAHLNELLENKKYMSLYSESKNLLRQLHYFLTGESILEPVPHWSLLESNGGPLPEDTYYGTQKTYDWNPNIVFLPAKLQYETVKSK